MPRIVDQSIARRLRLLAMISFLLACGAFTVVRSHESESWTHGESHVNKNVRTTTTSTSWPVAITMAIALTWALLEYAQLVLLLITDEEAVRVCYEQNYPAAQMKDEGERARMKEKRRSHHDRETIPEMRTEPKERVKSDQISTNIPATPSQLSDDSDAEETKAKCRGPAHIESSSPDKPICACEEDDYLVAMEDDVRRPCHTEPVNPATKRPVPILTHSDERYESEHGQGSPPKQTSVTEPKKAGAPSATPDTTHRKEEAEHHFKSDLLPAADETLMDAL